MTDLKHLRNFTIVAHIDCGKTMPGYWAIQLAGKKNAWFQLEVSP